MEVATPGAGGGTLMVRYCNPGTTDIIATVQVPGSAAAQLSLAPTGSQEEWRISATPVSIPAGTAGAIRISKHSGPSLFIDAAWIESGGAGPDLPADAITFEHHRPALDWRVARATTPGFNATGAATGIMLGAVGGALGQPFTGNCGIGVAVVDDQSWPDEHRGVYVGDFGGGWIRRASLDLGSRCGRPPSECDCARVEAVTDFDLATPAIVGISAVHDDPVMYVAQWTTLKRYRWLPGGSAAPEIDVDQSVRFGPSPLTVSFDASASTDPEGQALTFSWEFGDGQPPAAGPSIERTFANPSGMPAAARVTLRVTDAAGVTSTRELEVGLDNTPPAVRITSLADGQLYPTDLDTDFPLRGDILDSEHAAGEVRCEWQVILHHNSHAHPEPAITDCASSATIQATHCDDENVYWYEVSLTATDAHGLTGIDTVTLRPDCAGILRCPGDLNGDGIVDGYDLVFVLSNWGAPGNSDIDRNGVTSGMDLAILLSHWGSCR